MADRRFTELDLRRMLEKAIAFRRDIVEGRWTIETRHRRRPWEIIVEPDPEEELLIVITAYPVYAMKESYLEVTFRRGRPIAAYYYLPRKPGEKSVRTRRAQSGMLVDFSRAGRPIGIEITAPSKMSVSALNRLLRELGFSAVTRSELAPVLAA